MLPMRTHKSLLISPTTSCLRGRTFGAKRAFFEQVHTEAGGVGKALPNSWDHGAPQSCVGLYKFAQLSLQLLP